MIGRPAAILLLTATATLPGCAETSESPNPRLGVVCHVMFRRDALGFVDKWVTSPDAYLKDQGRLGVVGKLTRVTDKWLVIVSSQDEEFWIPRDVILCVMQRPDGRDFGGPFGQPEAAPAASPPSGAAEKKDSPHDG